MQTLATVRFDALSSYSPLQTYMSPFPGFLASLGPLVDSRDVCSLVRPWEEWWLEPQNTLKRCKTCGRVCE